MLQYLSENPQRVEGRKNQGNEIIQLLCKKWLIKIDSKKESESNFLSKIIS